MKDFFVLYLMYFSAADALSQREFRALEDDNASFLMLYAKCNTCSSISSFKKFNFKYASSEVDYFYEKWQSGPCQIFLTTSVIDQKDKETKMFLFLPSHVVNLMSHDND